MSFPNPWDSPDFFRRVKIGGRLIKASLVEINGVKIEDKWEVQKPTGKSGATNVFKGTDPAGPARLTFEIAGDTIDDLRDEWDDLREVYELLEPKPGSGGNGSGATTGSPGSAAYGKGYVLQSTNTSPAVATKPEDLLAKAQAALAALESGASTAAASSSSSSSSSSSAKSTASTPNPGPKPPTLSIENGYFNYVGITAVSRRSWEGPMPGPTNGQRVIIELVMQKEPTKAAVGAASPKTQDNPGQKSIAFGEIQGPAASAKASNAAAAAAGAGT